MAKGTLNECARTTDMTVCGKAAVMKAGSAHSAVLLQKRVLHQHHILDLTGMLHQVKCVQVSSGKQVCDTFKAGLCINLGR